MQASWRGLRRGRFRNKIRTSYRAIAASLGSWAAKVADGLDWETRALCMAASKPAPFTSPPYLPTNPKTAESSVVVVKRARIHRYFTGMKYSKG